MTPGIPAGLRVRVLAALALTTIASQFFRASTAAIAPDLVNDLGLTAQQFGAANGVFFLAIGIVQIPVGVLFDRHGPRRVTTALTALAVIGAVWQALCVAVLAGLLVYLGSRDARPRG